MAEYRHETDRLILREWREQDWPMFFAHTNTPAVMRWLGGVMNEAGMEMLRLRLESYQRDHGFTFWVVERKADGGHLSGELLGFCGLKRSNIEGGPSAIWKSAGACARRHGGTATRGKRRRFAWTADFSSLAHHTCWR